MTHTIDWTQVISTLALLFVNGVLIKWVWNVSKTQYENLKQEFTRYKEDTEKRIKRLETDLLESNKKATSWFKKFYTVALIIERGHCKGEECKIYKDYIEFQNKEGEVKQ